MERRTRGIASGDFSPMPLPQRNDEFRDLAGSINDMAEQLAQLQETMQRSERLRLLGQVSGGLAHQLRNGVAGARLALQVHARELNGQGDSEAVQVALRQLHLLEAHLQRFLNLGKVGERPRQTCLVDSLLNEAVNLLRPKSRHANVDLSWEKPEQTFPVLGNGDQLSQVFLNLIGNALDAAGPGGHVQVQIRQISNDTTDYSLTHHSPLANSFCRVEIADSGPGPPAAIAHRIFEPFITGKPDGVGLGLALARQVTEIHGGRIGWSRQMNQTVFFVELPLQERMRDAGGRMKEDDMPADSSFIPHPL
jgi:signal transduction histidine kinase